MPKKKFSAEQIVTLLRQIEVLMAQGKAAPEACREAGKSQQSFYRWRKEYGRLEQGLASYLYPLRQARSQLPGRHNAGRHALMDKIVNLELMIARTISHSQIMLIYIINLPCCLRRKEYECGCRANGF